MSEERLPKGWVSVGLQDVVKWGSGGTPSRSKKEYYGGSIPWIKTGDLNDSILEEASEFITELGLSNSSAKIFPKGSVCMAMYGATIGRTAILGMDAATNQACAVGQPSEAVLNTFLFNYLKSQKQNFIDQGKGGAQPNISQGIIKQHQIPLPPLAEQGRIVAKLDALMAKIDAVKGRLDQIPTLLKNFRQQVLTDAVTGKLTEIKGFDWVELDSFVESSFYGPRFSKDSYDESGLPTIRTSDMNERGEIVISDETPRVVVPAGKMDSFQILKDDLLITRTGSIGKMALYSLTIKAIPSAYLIRFRFLAGVNPKFIYYCLTSPYGQKIMGLESTAITQPNLNAKKIRAIKIPKYTDNEQREIVASIDSLFDIADRIEARYLSLKEKVDQLPQSLLAKAFRGELVKQDESEESAEVLLERVRSRDQNSQ